MSARPFIFLEWTRHACCRADVVIHVGTPRYETGAQGLRTESSLFSNSSSISLLPFWINGGEKEKYQKDVGVSSVREYRGQFNLLFVCRTGPRVHLLRAYVTCLACCLSSLLFRNSAWIYRPAGPNGHFTDEHVSVSRTVPLKTPPSSPRPLRWLS